MQTVWFCLPLSHVYDCNSKQRNNKIKLAWGLENKIWMIVTQPWKLYTRLCTLKYLVIIITSITQTLSQILSVREGRALNMLCRCHWVISWITYFRYLDHAESVEDKSSSSGEKNQPEEEEEDIKRFKSLSISCYLNRLDAMG